MDIAFSKKILSTVLLALSLILAAFPASAYTIEDTYTSDKSDSSYWGGTVKVASPSSYGDVIGYPYFSLDRMVITFDGPEMTVKITGAYFTQGITMYKEQGYFPPGDLYINPSGWNTNDNDYPNHKTDTFTQNEGWLYVVTAGNGSTIIPGVYVIDFDTTDMSRKLLWTSGPSGWIWRDQQAWRGGYGQFKTEATVSAPKADKTYTDGLTYTFDTSNLDLNASTGVGLHWTMKCGNDIIEGLDDLPPQHTPEPGTLFLLGAGLMGTGVAVRKKFKKA